MLNDFRKIHYFRSQCSGITNKNPIQNFTEERYLWPLKGDPEPEICLRLTKLNYTCL